MKTKFKKFKKIGALLLALVMIVTSMNGISAYFTDTDTATNVVTVGEIDIELWEPNWDGTAELVPNATTSKDPQIYNSGTSDAYVYLEVDIPYKTVITADTDGNLKDEAVVELFTYETNPGWVEIKTVTDETLGVVKHIYAYVGDDASTLKALPSEETTPTLFDEITFANVVDGQGLENRNLDVVVRAYAIQTNDINGGTTDPTEIWNILDNSEIDAIPMLAARGTWYTQGGTTYDKANITEIEFLDEYEPTGEEDESWDASAGKIGTVTAYRIGDKLKIAGNGYGLVYANPDSQTAFANFTKLEDVDGEDVLDTSKVTNMNGMFMICTSLKSLDVSTWNTSRVDRMAQTFDRCFALETLDVSDWDVSKSISTAGMFRGCLSLTELDLSKWDMSNVTSIREMFRGSAAIDGSDDKTEMQLTSIGDISNWDTTNVTNMMGVFYYCTNLKTIDLSGWDTSKVTDMKFMFNHCETLEELNIPNWDTSSCTTMHCMFQNCEKLSTVNTSNWDVSKVTDMSYMFNYCYALAELDVSNWDTSACTNMSYMFQGCRSIEVLDVSDWNTAKVTTMNSMFNSASIEEVMSIKELNVSNWNTSVCTNMAFMFSGCSSLEELNTTNWNTSSCVDMSTMFQLCENLKEINVSNWNTAKVTNMSYMFNKCTSLEKIDMSNWNTSKVTTMSSMFQECGKLTGLETASVFDMSSCTDLSFMFWGCYKLDTLDVSGWDVSKVTTFDHIFAHAGVTLIGVENWKTPAATNMNAMFHRVENTTLNVSNLDTSNVQIFAQMFQSCYNLEEIIGLENFDTSSGLDFEEMFLECGKIKELNLSSFDTTHAKDGVVNSGNGGKSHTMRYIFKGMTSLEKITLSDMFSFDGDGTTTLEENHALLPTPSSGYWYSSDGTAYAPENVPDDTADTYYSTQQ